MSDLTEFLRDEWPGLVLALFGVGVVAAEVWLLTIGTPPLLVATLLGSTGTTLYMVLRELWGSLV